MRKAARNITAVLLLLVLVSSARGQDVERLPIEPPDTSSPRATLESFIDGCNEIYELIRNEQEAGRNDERLIPIARRVFGCLDLSDVPDFSIRHTGADATVALKEVLDRTPLPPFDEIPGLDEAEGRDDEPPVLRWRLPGTPIEIVRMVEGPRQGEYLFTARTVDEAADLYAVMEALPYRTDGPRVSEGFRRWYLSEAGSPWIDALVDRLPPWMRNIYWHHTVWQWLGVAMTIIVGLLVMLAAYRIGSWQAGRTDERHLLRYCLSLLFPIAALGIPLWIRGFITYDLAVRGNLLVVTSFACLVLFLMAALVVIVSTTNRVAEIIISSPKIHPRGLDAQFIRLICRALGLTLAVLVFLEGGKYLGIPITTLLASAGIGGLAFALAAQDMLKNMFGSMMILLDKPFRVGDRIVIKRYDGFVEEIGLRSTRIRLLTGHMATIPNDEMARSDIENVGRRPHIRRVADVKLPLDTTREQLQQAVDIIRDLLDRHEGMDPDRPARVYFTEYESQAFNIRFFYWYSPPDYWQFLDYSERLNLAINQAFAEAGIKFSLPRRLTYTSPQSEPAPLDVRLSGDVPGSVTS